MIKKVLTSVLRIIILLLIVLGIIWILIARPSIPHIKDSKTNAVTVDSNLLYQHVKILSVDYLPRDYQHPDNLNASAAYIKDQFKKIGLKVTEQTYTVNDAEYKNIVTSLGPKTGSKLVIGAHYPIFAAFIINFPIFQ